MENKKYHSEIDNFIKSMRDSGFLNENNVESAFRNIPRHEFVVRSELGRAYSNKPLPIMKGQTISQPNVVSRMTEWLDVKEGQKILEIGCGSGWQSGILSYLVGDTGIVYSVEIHPKLVKFARENLDKLGIDNVHVILGDGSVGYPEASPYDRIIVTAACTEVPLPLLEQLAENGLLIAPVGDFAQSLVLLKKTSEGIVEIKKQSNYVFVPLRGKFGTDAKWN